MSLPTPYVADKYLSVDDALDHFGFTKIQQKSLSEEERARYTNWVKEGNGKVEADLFPFSDDMPLDRGSQEWTFAKSAVLNWVEYKKRDREGSKNASSAKNDFDRDIKLIKNLLKKTPTLRMNPITSVTTDSLSGVINPYSQTMGFPPDILY